MDGPTVPKETFKVAEVNLDQLVHEAMRAPLLARQQRVCWFERAAGRETHAPVVHAPQAWSIARLHLMQAS